MNKNLWILLGLFMLMTPLLVAAYDIPVYTEANRQIVQNANQAEFTIRLDSNPSTGYSWFLKPCDPNYIKVVQHQYIANTNKSLIGAGGVEMWRFRLSKMALTTPHIFNIEFVYARAWENKPGVKTVVFQVATH